MNKTPYFKGFNRLFGRAKKPAAFRLKEQVDQIRARAPGQLHLLFSEAVEPEKMESAENSRERIYSADVTFWAMLGQVVRGGSLRDAVREVQAASCARDGQTEVGDSTSSYCEARQRLPQSSIDWVHRRVCEKMVPSERLLGGRRVMVVDGTGVQLEDTPLNQEEYPQPSNQQPGCGFPVIQLVGLFNLDTTSLEHLSYSPQSAHEGGMFDVELMDHLRDGDVLLGDRAFCSYLHCSALARRGVDVLMRLHGSRQWPRGASGNDVLVRWRRPRASERPEHITEAEWKDLPETITVRYVRYRIQRAGFRTQEVMLVTTLMDTPVHELAQVYSQRWGIELCFDDIKTTIGMDFVRAKSPQMAIKLVSMHVIAYNLVRWLMQQAMRATGGGFKRLSFKGALDSMQRFTSQMSKITRKGFSKLRQKLFETIARDVLTERPGRFEPRVRKRRPKGFSLMTRPRAVLKAEIIRNHQAFLASI